MYITKKTFLSPTPHIHPNQIPPLSIDLHVISIMVECIIWKILLATQNLKQKQLRNLTTQLNLLTFHCLSIELLRFKNLFSMFWIIKANDSCSFSNNWCFLMKNIFKSLNQLVDHLLFSSPNGIEFIAISIKNM